LKIELDERELEIMLDALDCWRDKLHAGGNATDEVADLAADLFESLHRDDDGWGRENDAVPDAAAEFIQAGIDTREQVKASSRAAQRRIERTMASTASAVSNDPIDW
jgi:hypothetical protein